MSDAPKTPWGGRFEDVQGAFQLRFGARLPPLGEATSVSKMYFVPVVKCTG